VSVSTENLSYKVIEPILNPITTAIKSKPIFLLFKR